MWREQTRLEDFPGGWSEAKLAIEGDIFEAGHTYALKGLGKYLTLVEAQNGHGWRYYKAYLADRLDGEWQPIAATKDKSFASMANVEQPDGHWTDSISHGELLRAGVDQRLEVDPPAPALPLPGRQRPDPRRQALRRDPLAAGDVGGAGATYRHGSGP